MSRRDVAELVPRALLSDVNLLVAIRRTLQALKTFEGLYDPLILREWELELSLPQLGDRADRVRKLIQELDSPIPCYVAPLPKRDGRGRVYYDIPLEYQVGWTALVQWLGPALDRRMPRWSFGNRLYRPRYRHPDGRWLHGPYTYAGPNLYMPFARSYKPFRRYSILLLKAYLKQDIALDEGSVETEREESTLRREAWMPKPGLYLDCDLARTKFHLPSAGASRVYFAHLDVEKFYPSIDRRLLLETVCNEVSGYASRATLEPLLGRWLRFEEGQQLTPEQMKLLRRDGLETVGLPTGLIASGFLANAYLLPFDRSIEALQKTPRFRDVRVLRYVDDITVLAPTRDTLCRFLDRVFGLLEERRLRVNLEKLSPKPLEQKLEAAHNLPEEQKRGRVRAWLSAGGPCDSQQETEWDQRYAADATNRHQFVSTTLERMSAVAGTDAGMLDSAGLASRRLDLLDLADPEREGDEGDVRRDTRVSFALGALARTPLACGLLDRPEQAPYDAAEVEEWKEFRRRTVVRPTERVLRQATAVLRTFPEKSRLFRHWLRVWLTAGEVLEPEALAEQVESLVAFVSGSGDAGGVRLKPETEVLRPVLSASLLFRAQMEVADALGSSGASESATWEDPDSWGELFPEESGRSRLLDLAERLVAVSGSMGGREGRYEALLEASASRLELWLAAHGRETGPRAERLLRHTGPPRLAAIAELRTTWRPPNRGDDSAYSTRLLLSSLQTENGLSSFDRGLALGLERKLMAACPEWCVEYPRAFAAALASDRALTSHLLWSLPVEGVHEIERHLPNMVLSDEGREVLACAIRRHLDERVALGSWCSVPGNTRVSLRGVIESQVNFSRPLETEVVRDQPEWFRAVLGLMACQAWTPGSEALPDDFVIRLDDLQRLWVAMNAAPGKIPRQAVSYDRLAGQAQVGSWLNVLGQEEPEPRELAVLGSLLFGVAVRSFRHAPGSLRSSPFWVLGDVLTALDQHGPVSGQFSKLIASLVSARAVELARPDVKGPLATAIRTRFGDLKRTATRGCLVRQLKAVIRDLAEHSTQARGRSHFVLLSTVPPGARRDRNPSSRSSFRPRSKESFEVGIIQPNCDFGAKETWEESRGGLRLKSKIVDGTLWPHIRKVLGEWESTAPDLILIPEFCIPRGKIRVLERYATKTSTVVVAGTEYRWTANGLRNEAVVIVPFLQSPRPRVTFVPKCFAPKQEIDKLKSIGSRFAAGADHLIFDIPWLGAFNVSICYDLYSMDTFQAVLKKATHLFVPAFNKDVVTFDALAEAGMRLLFANVVIANSGHFGGSVAVAPFYDPRRREVMRFRGNKLESAFRLRLPLESLEEVRNGKPNPLHRLCEPVLPGAAKGCEGKTDPEFKSLPAGWVKV